MQIFLVIMINILLLSLFYVIISLKLEKSASEFRLKKLRQEADEIIREFNETAERNITLLENRIAILQKLIERSGNIKGHKGHKGLKGIDIILKNPEEGINIEESAVLPKKSDEKDDEFEKLPKKSLNQTFISKITNLVRKKLDLYLPNILNHNGIKNLIEKIDGKSEKKKEENYPITKNFEEVFSEPIEPESEIASKESKEDEIGEEIERLFAETDNKFLLINQLISDGFSTEEISRYSGVPEGEVKLVINLSK